VTDRHAGRSKAHRNDDRTRVNRSVTAPLVRLLGVDGQALGVVQLDVAQRQARDAGLDLVEIAPTAEPPVCRIIDYSKWRYQQDKLAKARRQHTPDTKEIQLRIRIGEGDLVTKLRKAREFLTHGDPVRIVVLFKGREITHPELAERLLERVASDLDDIARRHQDARQDGRRITLTYLPKTTGC